METIRKARKVYTCYVCHGNIQKGEKYFHGQYKLPDYNDEINPDFQTGIWYDSIRTHNKNCSPRLLGWDNNVNVKNILKNCNFGIHNRTYDMDPDSYDDTEWCKWCGKVLPPKRFKK